MGRKLEQFKRGDSREQIHFPLGSSWSKKSSKRLKDPTSRKEEIDPAEDSCSLDTRQARKAKIDRVESIRNLFRRSRSWDSAKDLDDVPPEKSNIISTSCDLLSSGEGRGQEDFSIPALSETRYESLEPTCEERISPSSLFRSDSIVTLPASLHHPDSDVKESRLEALEKVNDFNDEGEKSEKKGNFPYAFLRSRLTAVTEERNVVARDECADSGRGTGSQCGSVSDIRMSYSENSDTKSFSESSDSKSSCSDSSHREEDEQELKAPEPTIKESSRSPLSPIPAPTGFGDGDYVVTLKVEGNVTPSSTSVYINGDDKDEQTLEIDSSLPNIAQESQLKIPLTDEEKLKAIDSSGCHHCTHCGKLKVNDTSSSKPVRRRLKSLSSQRPKTLSTFLPVTESLYESIYPSMDIQGSRNRSYDAESLNSYSLKSCQDSNSLLSSSRYRRRAPSLPRVPLLTQVGKHEIRLATTSN